MKAQGIRKAVAALRKIEGDVLAVERACVAGYLAERAIRIPARSFLRAYLAGVDPAVVDRCRGVLASLDGSLGLEVLVELFELLVSDEKRKKNGVAYTPYEVKALMLKSVLEGVAMPTVFDPSCGCASFLLTAAQMIHEATGRTYTEIIRTCIFGADIDGNALEKTRALFSLLLAENGEPGCVEPGLFNLDMLDRASLAEIRTRFPRGFDCVVGNPPYVRFRNMDEATKGKVNGWTVSACGNADLYMPFFEIGMDLAADGGVLAYITSNTYLQSVNGRCLRNWMADEGMRVEITDFRDAQLFANVTCYTCVTILRACGRPGISYRRASDPAHVGGAFTDYRLDSFPPGAPWRLRSPDIDSVIGRLEGVGRPLSEYVIRNGLATLANDVFFFHAVSEDGEFVAREYGGREWKIERAVCRRVAKPNVIHNEIELQSKMEYAIFPYSEKDGRLAVLDEPVFRRDYPLAYAFLCNCKKTLSQRDKGKGAYPAWYAYGRTQGLNSRGCKLLIPYIAGRPTAVLSMDRDLLFYCGYALIDDNVEELRYLKVFLESDAFWFYIHHTSKPYSKGFMALAKNYITRFSIPDLDPASRRRLLAAESKSARNRMVWEAYGISPSALLHSAIST